MRRIMVESARRKQCIKHGGELRRILLEIVGPAKDEAPDELLRMTKRFPSLQARTLLHPN